MAALGIVQALTGVAAVGSMTFLLWTVEQGWKTMGLWQAVVIAILPPSLFMGIGFPLALGMAGRRSSVDREEDIAQRVGVMYSLNVAGAIAGSLGAGFLLLPRIGSVNALIALAAMFVASGLWLLPPPPRLRWTGRLSLVRCRELRFAQDRAMAMVVGARPRRSLSRSS